MTLLRDFEDEARKRGWRVGKNVPINVYDEEGRPICQCHTAVDAALIVRAVNRLREQEAENG